MELGTIEREIRIEAAPDVVYRVVSTPEHLQQWWSDEAERVDGSDTIRIAFGDSTAANRKTETLTVVEEDPPRRFAFRWVHDEAEPAGSRGSLLVTFDLVPAGDGTLLRFSETGFREKGWDDAVLEKAYRDHERGWGLFLPRLVAHVDRLEVAA